MSKSTRIEFVVLPEERGVSLLAYLRDKLSPEYSVKSIKRAIDAKWCLVNGKVENFSTHLLKKGDLVSLDKRAFEKKTLILQEAAILYEDEEILICNKPAGVVSEKQPLNALFPRYRGQLIPVHRLDKETSGVLALSKTREMEGLLIDLFAKREMKKSYLALVHGEMHEKEGNIDNFLSKKHSYQGQTVWGVTPRGTRAITKWRLVRRGSGGVSLILCQPITGRTHQLRVHLSHKGCPILGDAQYGKVSTGSYRAPRVLLHAYSLGFVHPKTGAKIEITAQLPQDFQEACARFSIDIPKDVSREIACLS